MCPDFAEGGGQQRIHKRQNNRKIRHQNNSTVAEIFWYKTGEVNLIYGSNLPTPHNIDLMFKKDILISKGLQANAYGNSQWPTATPSGEAVFKTSTQTFKVIIIYQKGNATLDMINIIRNNTM